MTGYQYRALMQGGCTAVDFSSPPATLTVTPLIATVNPVSATICTGGIQQLSLTNVSSPATAAFASGTINIAIPDVNTATGINHTIPVSLPAGSIISRVDVRLNITHNWVSDLEIVLKAPNGAILNLSNLVTGTNQAGANFTNTVISSIGTAALNSGVRPGYTGTFKPDAIPGPAGAFGVPAGPTGFLPTVTSFAGLYSTPSGNWTIAMYDAGTPDAGVLNNWSLDITYGAAATGIWSGTAGTMFTDAGATVPYVAGSQANTIYVKPTATTNYSVVYSTPTPCTSPATVVTVNVSNPVAGLAVTPLTRAICLGGSTTFTATTTGGGPLTYQWQSSPNGTTWTDITGATGATLTLNGVTSAMSGNRYRVTATAAPCGSVTSTVVGQLTVNPLPTVAITAADLTLTPGQNTTVTATSTPAGATWSWTRNGILIGGAPTSNTRLATIDSIGTYQVTVTDVNGCVQTSNTLVIGTEASDRLWIYPNPSDGIFQVRLYYKVGNVINEKRVVSVYTAGGDLVARKEFALDNVTSPYLKMAFDLSKAAPGTYVVKVADKYSGQVVSGLLVIAR
jgi:subtilisin-like proprotein convertase family protein